MSLRVRSYQIEAKEPKGEKIYRTRRELDKAIKERSDIEKERGQIIRANAGHRMAGRMDKIKDVPPKPGPILVPIAYEKDGTYAGFLEREEDLPGGCIVKWEPR